MKKTVFICLLAVVLSSHPALAGHMVRVSGSCGYSVINDIAGNGSFSASGRIALAYPVSYRKNAVNSEISLLALYELQVTGKSMQVPGFGFGIRVFYNELGFARPYFNHEVLSRVLYVPGRQGIGRTYSVLLGFGLDFPFNNDREADANSVFADISYVFYDTGYFEAESGNVKTFFINAGYSQPF